MDQSAQFGGQAPMFRDAGRAAAPSEDELKGAADLQAVAEFDAFRAVDQDPVFRGLAYDQVQLVEPNDFALGGPGPAFGDKALYAPPALDAGVPEALYERRIDELPETYSKSLSFEASGFPAEVYASVGDRLRRLDVFVVPSDSTFSLKGFFCEGCKSVEFSVTLFQFNGADGSSRIMVEFCKLNGCGWALGHLYNECRQVLANAPAQEEAPLPMPAGLQDIQSEISLDGAAVAQFFDFATNGCMEMKQQFLGLLAEALLSQKNVGVVLEFEPLCANLSALLEVEDPAVVRFVAYIIDRLCASERAPRILQPLSAPISALLSHRSDFPDIRANLERAQRRLLKA